MTGLSTPLASAAPMAACVCRTSSGVAAQICMPKIADSFGIVCRANRITVLDVDGLHGFVSKRAAPTLSPS